MRHSPKPPSSGRRSLIGLDIGSSAVRAVELAGSAERPRVVRFGQIGLDPGVVEDGEVRDAAGLAGALQRLWEEGGFTSRRVNVSVAGQRVIVREASVTAMSAEDFRSAMVFEAQDLIPIPTADAVMDFTILGPDEPGSGGGERMRIQLAAADRQGVQRLLDTLRQANLEAVAIDVPQAALLRGTRCAPGDDDVLLVSVGADLTNVVVRSESRTFSRTLAVGASEITKGIGVRLGVGAREAEAVKRYAGGSDRAARRAGDIVDKESGPVIEQVLESIDYFQAQARTRELQRVLLTGGGARTAGLADRLAEATALEVEVVDPFEGLDTSALPPDMAADARAVAVHAVGLASWGWEPASARLSLLPPEILEAARRRQVTMACVAGGLVLCVALGAVWYGRHRQIASVSAQAAAVNASSTALRAATAQLNGVNVYFETVDGRQHTLSALSGGVDYSTLISQAEAALPSDLDLTSVTVTAAPTGATGSSAATSATSGATAGTGLGTVSLELSGQGTQVLVSDFLRSIAGDRSLSDVLVPSSATSTTGRTTFTATGDITKQAPRVTYAWESK